MYFFPKMLTNSQSMSKFKNNTKTLSLLLCLHLAESVLQRMPNAVHYLNFKTNRAVYAGSSLVYVNTDESWFVIVEFFNSFKLCETAKISDKKYINVKVWL